MKVPKAIARLIESFEKLPGIGPKTAQRLTFYLLHVPQSELDSFAEALGSLKKQTVLCSICKNVDETDPCSICSDRDMDKRQVMVVEQPLDVLAIERARKYRGVYHVLHGAINPLENIGPDELYIKDLLKRVKPSYAKASEDAVHEIILATNPTMEGEATAMYIKKEIEKLRNKEVKITRLGLGLPTGADIEYVDETTIREAIEGRRGY